MEGLAAQLAFGAVGAAWGFVADRIATRWPEHEPAEADETGSADEAGRTDAVTPGDDAAESDTEVSPAAEIRTARAPDVRRGLDWRTAVLVGFGFALGVALAARYSGTRDLVIVGVYLVALTLLLATDLDQRLLPDAITLPMIPVALAVLLFGWDPVLSDKALGIPSGLVAGIAFPALLLGGSALVHGGLGWGDVKLLVSVGLVSGVSALLVSLLVASVAFGLVLAALLAARRVSLRSYVPFGPVIILAAAIAVLGG